MNTLELQKSARPLEETRGSGSAEAPYCLGVSVSEAGSLEGGTAGSLVGSGAD